VPALFARILGDAFDQLPRRVRELHACETVRTYRGVANVERGRSWLAQLFSAATSLPRAGHDVASEVTIEPNAESETWTRDFAGHQMRSRLWESHGELSEKLGAATFSFALSIENQELVWRVIGVRIFGLPLSAAWFANVVAREFESDGCYRFDVHAQLPGVGLLIHYHGRLDVS
jgi:hypothetical protein